MKKILHISKYYYPFRGGTEQVAQDCVNSLRAEYEQKVICFNHEAGNTKDKVDGIEVIRCNCVIKISSQSISLSYGKILKNTLEVFNPDIIIFHYPNPFVAVPAILLAAAYLHDELGVSAEDVVAVCPVDPYVENSYYRCVKMLEATVEQGAVNLTLMGVQPTYPSEKYGYIIPETDGEVSSVKEFKEKPDTETAKEYLKQNALWNAGVFAFKLSYLLEKAHSMVEFTDYRDLYAKYETLEKISFDYAVVEKEQLLEYVLPHC